MVREYKEMAERSENPPDFREAFVSVMQRYFQGQTPGLRVNIDLLGETIGYVGDQFGRLLDIQNPTLKANIGAVSSMVGTRVGNILEYTGISPYIQQAHNLAEQHLAKGEQKILGLVLGTGIPMGASKLAGMLKSRYGTNKLVPKVSVGKLEHAKTTAIVKPKNSSIQDIKAQNVNAKFALSNKLSSLQSTQKSAAKVRELPDGRIRYYEKERPSSNIGFTRGSSYVTEHNPKTGQVKSWNECYDHFGKVNRIHPKSKDGLTLKAQHYPLTQKEFK